MSKKKAQVRMFGFAAMDEVVCVCVVICLKGCPPILQGLPLPVQAYEACDPIVTSSLC